MRYDLITTTYMPGLAATAAQAAASGETSGLAGYWTSEIGTLNQTVELWSQPRPVPVGEPLSQESHKLSAIVGPTAPEFVGGIYELRHYRLRPGATASWVAAFTDKLPAREKYSKIVGLFASDPGEADRVVHIWAYPDLNTRAAARAAALKDPDWLAFLAISRGQKFAVWQDNAILLPAAHSPLK